jgi:hypothetical protein
VIDLQKVFTFDSLESPKPINKTMNEAPSDIRQDEGSTTTTTTTTTGRTSIVSENQRRLTVANFIS